MRVKIFIMLMAFLITMGIGLSDSFAMSTGTSVSNETLGDALVFGYYDTRTSAQGGADLTDNYFTITNTSKSWIQGHVRVRTGDESLELLDFDAVLSPKDILAFNIRQTEDGHISFSSCDTNTLIHSAFTLNYDRDGDDELDCFIGNTDPASEFFLPAAGSTSVPLMTQIITACTDATQEEAVEETLKGYAEFIGEGTFTDVDDDSDCEDGTGTRCCESMLEDGEYTLNTWEEEGCDVDDMDNVYGKNLLL
jgi:hypothetical protein